MSKPTDDMIVLAMILRGRGLGFSGPGWLCADEVRGTLRRLGFNFQTQTVAAWLGRLSREECPMVERCNNLGRDLEYRVTGFGYTQLGNRFPVTRAMERWARQ